MMEDESERLRTALSRIADKAKYLSEPAWNLEGCALVGKQIHRWAVDALAGEISVTPRERNRA